MQGRQLEWLSQAEDVAGANSLFIFASMSLWVRSFINCKQQQRLEAWRDALEALHKITPLHGKGGEATQPPFCPSLCNLSLTGRPL